MIKTVFFDVANTLLDKPELYPNIEKVLLKHGHRVDRHLLAQRHRLLSEVLEFPDKTSQEFYTRFNTQLLFMLGIIPEANLVQEIFDACTYLPWKAFDDVVSIAAITLPKGVISNWDKTLPEKLNEFVDAKFEWILGSEQMMVRKPNPVFYKSILTHTGFAADEILYVGDSLKLDIEPALTLGIQAVLIDRLDLYPGALVKRIKNMEEINQFL